MTNLQLDETMRGNDVPEADLFQGERVLLRAFEPGDIPELWRYLNDPGLSGRRYIPWKFPVDFPLSRKQAEEIYNQWSESEKETHLAIVPAENRGLIGHCSLDWGWDPFCPSLSIVIIPSQQRQGYGSEVLEILLGYLFENTPAHNISGEIADWNQPAREFSRAHGFQESGRWRRAGMWRGKYYDEILVDILRPEWVERGGSGDGA
jgi:RimJ/RimL family protein N-acetyltransferase